MKKTKIISLLLSATLLFLVCGCGAEEDTASVNLYGEEVGEESAEAQDDKESSSKKNGGTKDSSKSKGSSSKTSTTSQEKELTLNNVFLRERQTEYYTLGGRSYFLTPTSVKLHTASSSVEFAVECQGRVTINFTAGFKPVYVEIYVDGKVIDGGKTLIEKSGEYLVAENLSAGQHTFKIIRQTDIESGDVSFVSLSGMGVKLCKVTPSSKKLYIEAIGDSALLGYGVNLEDDFFTSDKYDSNTPKSSLYMDATATYVYQASETLNADCDIVARQGLGIAATYHTSMEIGRLSGYYDYSDVSTKKLYNFPRQADVIIVDCGYADMNKSLWKKAEYNGKTGINAEDVLDLNVEFFKKIKAKNPNAKIIWCYGIATSSDEFESHINKVMEKLGGSKNGFYTLKLEKTQRKTYPSKAEHTKAAKLLVQKIKEIL